MTDETMFPEGMKLALAALYSPEPVTDEERKEHDRQVRRQIAKDEARLKMQRDLLDKLR